MITLHRLGRPGGCFQLNPDLIVSVERTPDTVLTLTTSAKVVVADSVQHVEDAVRAWKAEVLAEALRQAATPLHARRAQPARPALAALAGGAAANSEAAADQRGR